MTWRKDAAETFVAAGAAIRKHLEAGTEPPFGMLIAAKTYGALLVEAGALLDDEDAAPDAPEPPLRLVAEGDDQ